LGVTYGVMVTSMVVSWWFYGVDWYMIDVISWTIRLHTERKYPTVFPQWFWVRMAYLIFSTQKPLFNRGLENIVGRPCKRRV
jgi:hypothetical protein